MKVSLHAWYSDTEPYASGRYVHVSFWLEGSQAMHSSVDLTVDEARALVEQLQSCILDRVTH